MPAGNSTVRLHHIREDAEGGAQPRLLQCVRPELAQAV